MSARTIAVIIVILLIAAGIGAYVLLKKPATVAAAELEILQGEVEVQPTPQARVLTASANMALPATARIKTKSGSRAALKFKSGSLIRIDENTEIVLADLSDVAGKSRVSFQVESGQAWARVRQLLETESFEATTANTVAQVRGTSFNTRYHAPTTTLFVWKGMVGTLFRDPETKQVDERIGEVRVGERKSVRLDPVTPAVGIQPRDVTPEEVEDPWVLFNRGEDRRLDEAEGIPVAEPVAPETATTTATTTPAVTASTVETRETPKIQSPAATQQPAPPAAEPPREQPRTEEPRPPATPKTLEISYDGSPSIFVDDTIQFIATLIFSDGRRELATDRVQWAVSSFLGTITKDGFFRATRVGTGQVTASLVIGSDILRASYPITVRALPSPEQPQSPPEYPNGQQPPGEDHSYYPYR